MLRCILFTCRIQLLMYSCILSELELLIHLQFLYLFCNCPSVSCSFIYFISAAVTLLASNFKIRPLDNRRLGKINTQLGKIKRRFELDMRPGTTESVVEFNSTLDLVQRKALSNLIRHWTWYNGKRCRI